MHRRSILLGALPAPFLAGTRAKAAPTTLRLECYSPQPRSRAAAQFFAEKVSELSSGALQVEVDVVMLSMPLSLMSKASAFAYYYPPLFSKTESVLDLCGVPMLVGSLDEAETLLRIARPYYSTALARHGQILLMAQPWRPAALWSTFRLRSARDLEGATFGQPAPLHAWHGLFVRLGVRRTSYADATVTLSYGYISSLEFAQQFAFMAEIFHAVQLTFLTVSQEVFGSLPGPERQAILAAGRETELAQWKYIRDFLPHDQRYITTRGVVVDTKASDLTGELREAAEPDVQEWIRSTGEDGARLLVEFHRAIGRS